MKKIGFILLGVAALAAAACGRKETDQLNESEAQNVEQEALDNLASDAANAEMEALGSQQQQLEAENAAAAAENIAAPDEGNATDPSKVEDDVQGM